MWASSADRDRAAEVLKHAFAEGRLTFGEFDERLGQVLTARTFETLMLLTGDLPVGPFGRLPAHRVTPSAQPGASGLRVVLALVMPGLVLVILLVLIGYLR